MSQTAYQTYLEGTEYLLAADRDPRMIQRSDDLELYNRNLSNNARALKTPGMISTLSLDGERLTASITGTIDTGFSPLRSVPLKISVTGPLLALDNGAAGDLSSFENSTRLFDNNEVSCDAAIVGCAISPVRSCSQNRPCDCSCSGSFCPNYGALICP